MHYRIKKLKVETKGIGEPKIELSFEKLNEANYVLAEVVLKTSRLNSKKLRDALYELNDEVIKISEFSLRDDQLMAVREIRFGKDEKKGLAVQFVCELLLKNSHDNLIFKTPVKYDESKDEKESLSENLRSLVDEVITECDSFIESEQTQLQLEFQE